MGTGHARGLRKEEGMDRINTQEREMERYWLWLCSCPGLYRSEIAGLIGYFRNPKQLYEAQPRELIRWKKLADAATTAWVNALINYKDTTSVVEAEERLALRKLHFVSRQSPLFPEKLKNLPDCPWGLFYRGRLPDPGKSAVAVIGARRCSNYGKQMAAVLGKALALDGYQVISGMAAGVDGTAQAACIDSGSSSFAVLGCGADVCYPAENGGLYDRLIEEGGVISEFAPMTPPLRHHFPMRNRLISGLSDAVIVVEARAQSGSLITADLALDQGKDVFVYPGEPGSPRSEGNHQLLREGAIYFTCAEDLLEDMGWLDRKEQLAQNKETGKE